MKPILLSLFAATLTQARIPIAPGAELRLVADGHKFTEGPAVDPKGDVYFTDQPNDRILKWSAATNKVETFLQPSGRSNGLDFDREGMLIACTDEKSQLWRIDLKTKQHTVILDIYDKKPLNGPNDVWVDPQGGMYFTEPFTSPTIGRVARNRTRKNSASIFSRRMRKRLSSPRSPSFSRTASSARPMANNSSSPI